jgi:hypothetical protein
MQLASRISTPAASFGTLRDSASHIWIGQGTRCAGTKTSRAKKPSLARADAMISVLVVGYDADAVNFSDPSLPPGLDAEKVRGLRAIWSKCATVGGSRALLRSARCQCRPQSRAPVSVRECIHAPVLERGEHALGVRRLRVERVVEGVPRYHRNSRITLEYGWPSTGNSEGDGTRTGDGGSSGVPA